jgi:hypothetical protein
LRFKFIYISIFVLAFAISPARAQEETKTETPTTQATPTPAPTPELSENEKKGIAIAESVILVYSQLQGSGGLDRIGKTLIEIGTLEYPTAEGTGSKSNYEYRSLRGDNLDSAKIRLDQRFPDAEFALIYDGKQIYGIYNKTKFAPTVEAVAAFSDRYWHGLPALLRYRSNSSKVIYDRDETRMGVEYSVIKLTDSSGRVTDYYVSKKSFRVMMLEYESRGVSYRRKFYDYNYAQNVLFPYRTVLWADNKKVEEQRTATITFGQEFAEEFFDVS